MIEYNHYCIEQVGYNLVIRLAPVFTVKDGKIIRNRNTTIADEDMKLILKLITLFYEEGLYVDT